MKYLRPFSQQGYSFLTKGGGGEVPSVSTIYLFLSSQAAEGTVLKTHTVQSRKHIFKIFHKPRDISLPISVNGSLSVHSFN